MTTSREPVRLALRKLWSDHVIWTREYIVAAVAGTPDAERRGERLLRNQEDIGAAVAGFYGQAAGDRLTELLKEHILIAVDLVAAAKTGDQAAFATHDARWTANIETIAAFLAGANPNWPEKDVLDLLALHLKLTKDETVARITGDWAADVKAFDDIFTEIMVLADALNDGIVAQFPERFGRRRRRHDRPRRRRRRRPSGRPSRSAPRPRRSRGCSAPTAGATVWRASPRRDAASCSSSRRTAVRRRKAYAERMNALQSDVRPARRPARWRSTRTTRTSIPDESYPRMVERAAEDGYAFPYLVDDGQRVARAYGAACTFHVFVLDRERRVRYQGRFDDSRLPERVTTPRPPERASRTCSRTGRSGCPTTRPFGCSLDLV